MVELTAKNGDLHLSGKLLVCRHAEGDCDTIPWPLRDRDHDNLRRALYDERERGGLDGDQVILPNGDLFLID